MDKAKDGKTKIQSRGEGIFYIGKQRAVSTLESVVFYNISYSAGRRYLKEITNDHLLFYTDIYPVRELLFFNGVFDTTWAFRSIDHESDNTRNDDPTWHHRYVRIIATGLCPIDTIVLYENGLVDTAAMIAYLEIAEDTSTIENHSGYGYVSKFGGIDTWNIGDDYNNGPSFNFGRRSSDANSE